MPTVQSESIQGLSFNLRQSFRTPPLQSQLPGHRVFDSTQGCLTWQQPGQDVLRGKAGDELATPKEDLGFLPYLFQMCLIDNNA